MSSFILFQHFHNPFFGNSEEAFWAFCVCSTQRYVSLKLGVCWQMGSLVRSIVSSLCVGRQQQGLPSSRLVGLVGVCSSPETTVAFVLLLRGLPSYQVFQFGKLCNTHTFSVVLLCGCSDSSYNIPALIRRVPAKQPLLRSAAVSFGVNAPIKSSSLTRCAKHIRFATYRSVNIQTVPSKCRPSFGGRR